jgi:hypothetical protein
MSTCANCQKWIIKRVTKYEDGSVVTNFDTGSDSRGICEALKIETDFSFGCNQWIEGHDHIEVMGTKTGSPWHHSHYGPCPDSNGQGVMPDGGLCQRCCGTGKVLYYDDGYVGEEKTRRHPNEETIGPPAKPICPGCNTPHEPQWKACPHCGTRLPGAEVQAPVRVSEFNQ